MVTTTTTTEGAEEMKKVDKAMMEVTEVIENSQQFFNWYAGVELNMERGREDVYR